MTQTLNISMLNSVYEKQSSRHKSCVLLFFSNIVFKNQDGTSIRSLVETTSKLVSEDSK
jgi:hypothetical protein